MNNILEIKNLNKSYFKRGLLFKKAKSADVLLGVDLNLKEGCALGLVGQSGCGKTTLAKVVLGLEDCSSGTIIIDGKDICTLSGKEYKNIKKYISAVFQDPYSSLNPRMTVRQIVSEPCIIHNTHTDKKELEKHLISVLKSVGLGKSDLTRYPHEFSGGQRQRVALARALALSPKLLIADEPTSALDVSVQAQVLNLIKEIKEKFNLSILFISHDINAARFLCDEIAVMHKGKIIERGPAHELLNNPSQKYTKELLAATPQIGGQDNA